ncbi:maleylpyruvate isomerase N-terminal domain-containing protein [Kitasatospora sp. NBC_01539]|uniref:maleylpyruvate isomerase N-terminal domain-containing protein n=1 Tax=Kitasatospora sp. NBC_01539 TaxID=2903577 RepID=UPI0038601C73
MDGRDVDRALAESLAVLAGRADDDWSVRAGPLTWTCREAAEHVAHDLAAYAGQLAARPREGYLPFDLVVRPEAPVAELLQVVRAGGGLLTGALALAGPDVRAWHWGPCDPSGFAAMGTAEILLHTWDITRGLRVDWHLPAPLAAAVLARLFPDAPGGDPAEVLLWCTGRAALAGRARRTSWTWQASLG